jgi:histidine ammonia-lyase
MVLPQYLTIDILSKWNNNNIIITPEITARIAHNRAYLDKKLTTGKTFYGVNTGFGSLCNVLIGPDELSKLQENLVCSHACGMGDEVPEEIVRLMLLLKVHGLSQGYSGVHPELVQRLADMYNYGMMPVIYELGSLGASGDLAPLAHLSLPILGKGEINYKGQKHKAANVMAQLGINPMPLAAKEGLALLNGTQFMSAYGSWCLIAAKRLLVWADVTGALSADAFMAKSEPFSHALHRVRPHNGQIATAQRLRELLKGSQIQALRKEQVQDPYSFRCMPQVHGATKDVVDTVCAVIEIEINSVTDNPIVFHDEDAILSGGNFHGQPLALHLDFLAIAMAELGSIAERRIFLLISGQRDLPNFLAPDAGLNSGFMIAQYTAASIVSQNKQLCTPASVDTIVSSNGQEDHVSMGANAATKLYRVIKNVQRVLAIELLVAAQAIDLRRPLQTSAQLEAVCTAFRENVAYMNNDRILHNDMVAAEQFLNNDPYQWIHA